MYTYYTHNCFIGGGGGPAEDVPHYEATARLLAGGLGDSMVYYAMLQ